MSTGVCGAAVSGTAGTARSSVPDSFASAGGAARWNAQRWLSRPAASWTVTLRNTATATGD